MIRNNFFDSESIYPKLPIILQGAACWYHGKRESRKRFNDFFYKKLESLIESENWSSQQIEEYQNEKLRELVRYAYDNVPYYREVMSHSRLSPHDIRRREDLEKLPILSKEEVRSNFSKLISQKIPSNKLIFKHTSGTTGKSLQFYVDQNHIPFQWAIWWRHRKIGRASCRARV